jgi:hypothetical protein
MTIGQTKTVNKLGKLREEIKQKHLYVRRKDLQRVSVASYS